MAYYVHNVPGRLRVKDKQFGHKTVQRSCLLRKLSALCGVNSVRLNERAASVTIYYDNNVIDAQRLMSALQVSVRSARDDKPQSIFVSKRIAGHLSKAALNIIVSKSVAYSLSSVFGLVRYN